MPALIHFQVIDDEQPWEPTTDRAVIERLARDYLVANVLDGLKRIVIETRYNVIRSNVPHKFTTARMLGDYLPNVRS